MKDEEIVNASCVAFFGAENKRKRDKRREKALRKPLRSYFSAAKFMYECFTN
jgi:hypothetical protein